MPQKTHKTAVVIIPPEKIWHSIQKIREKYDRQFRRWMPHFTLIYPFRPKDQFDDLSKQFAEICHQVPAFHVQLREFRIFKHHKGNFTLWLAPEPRDVIVELQSKLSEIIPDCNDVKKYKNGFTPHLSVGQFKGKRKMERVKEALQSEWDGISFAVSSIHFIWRNDPPDDVFRVGEEISLKTQY